MPVSPRRPLPLRGRVFRGSDAIARGLLTRAELRSRAWRPLFRDVYADAQLAVSHHTRCLAAARWVLPDQAAIAGRSAAALYGVGSVGPTQPLDVLVPMGHRFGPVAGFAIHTAESSEAEVRLHAGIRVTTPVRTCWDLAQWLAVEEAVAVVDGLVRRRLVRVETLQGHAHARLGLRGWKRLLRVADLADPGAESRPESVLRVRLVMAGLPRPVTQFVVEHDGRFVARVDLAWPRFRVAVEYDGVWHHDPEQLHRDRRRLNRLVGQGWTVLHVTAKRLKDDFEGVVTEIRHALRSRAR
ncbi:endonuclease domain-containing protein [Micromonospora musae]|uniref:DUF559 domain-containing protein n=1 Tax=Micromonospora musae TaxID=1894970 RepID=A0A3A9YE02_9ACTN|nr:DUF559 domain-containing protein [Micromonospora musae]RKN35372.1 DUF559 domain-containing protein [Micromonospora musae]